METRSLLPFIEKDLEKKFVLLAGPRQVGKTTLASRLVQSCFGQYYNWDNSEDREKILKKIFLTDGFVVLDELHKYDRWKNFLKGIYDKFHESLKVMVTGSARLDIYRRGGDSLFGRHYLYHLHPLTIREVIKPEIPLPENFLSFETKGSEYLEGLMNLFQFGGFPEPFYSASQEEHSRWSILRRELLVHQDMRDMTHVQLLSLVEHLYLLLPNRVGSVLSLNSLREDLQVAYNSIVLWLNIFERLYICYRLYPYSQKINRSLHKPAKLYLWDWSQIKEEGDRFENMVASHLLKAVNYWKDLGYGDYGLGYLRDSERREVDFCVTKDQKPWILVEAKLAETEPTEALKFFAQKFLVPSFQVVLKKGIHFKKGFVEVMSADKFLTQLP